MTQHSGSLPLLCSCEVMTLIRAVLGVASRLRCMRFFDTLRLRLFVLVSECNRGTNRPRHHRGHHQRGQQDSCARLSFMHVLPPSRVRVVFSPCPFMASCPQVIPEMSSPPAQGIDDFSDDGCWDRGGSVGNFTDQDWGSSMIVNTRKQDEHRSIVGMGGIGVLGIGVGPRL